ncbi:MAG: universal stress protein [Myxococcota bacterium]
MEGLKRLLTATDFSKASDNALAHAAFIAKESGAELHMLHVRIPFPNTSIEVLSHEFPGPERFDQALERMSDKNLEALQAPLDVPLVKKLVIEDDVSEAIAKYVQRHDIELVVVGTHARGRIGRFFLGSVAERTARTSPVSVLAVGPGEEHRAKKTGYNAILVPLDFSTESVRAFDRAYALAERRKARVIALHVIEPVIQPEFPMFARVPFPQSPHEAESRIRELLKAFIDERGARRVDIVLASGRPYHQIAEVARDQSADLIVMGAHGLGLVERLLLGSVTERTLRSAPCPVLVNKGVEVG